MIFLRTSFIFPKQGKAVAYYTRVLSKQEDFPSFEELARLIRETHPDFKLSIESGEEEEWESLLLSSIDEVEVAVIERNPVYDGSTGQDEVADLDPDQVESDEQADNAAGQDDGVPDHGRVR